MRLAVYPVKLVPQKNLLFTMNKPAVADFPDMESPSTYTQVSLSNAYSQCFKIFGEFKQWVLG